MRGDESGLGTPEEDLTSVAALAAIEGPDRLVVSIGFGVDAYHGVSHGLVLENIAALERDGAYLGAFSVPRASREGALFLDTPRVPRGCPVPRRGGPRTGTHVRSPEATRWPDYTLSLPSRLVPRAVTDMIG